MTTEKGKTRMQKGREVLLLHFFAQVDGGRTNLSACQPGAIAHPPPPSPPLPPRCAFVCEMSCEFPIRALMEGRGEGGLMVFCGGGGGMAGGEGGTSVSPPFLLYRYLRMSGRKRRRRSTFLSFPIVRKRWKRRKDGGRLPHDYVTTFSPPPPFYTMREEIIFMDAIRHAFFPGQINYCQVPVAAECGRM